MKVLVINCGSSSLKYQLIDMETEEVLAKGNYERIGQYNSFLTHKVNGEKHNFEKPASNHEKAIKFVLDRLLSKQYGVIKSVDEIDGIGHRIVHGGEKFIKQFQKKHIYILYHINITKNIKYVNMDFMEYHMSM